MKTSIITDILVIGFYEYIRKYWWIFWLKKSMRQKLIKTCENAWKNSKNNKISKNTHTHTYIYNL